MKLELVRRGRGPLVVAFHVGADTLREACAPLGDACLLLGIASSYGSPPSWDAILAGARAAGWQGAPTVLLGWSAGAGAVRELLRAGARPDAAVCLDGGVGGGMPPNAEVVRVWREAAERGRRGEALVVLSHIYQTYTERLPAPFPSTVTVARAATGWPLPKPAASASPARRCEGGLVVLSWPSADIDRAAHAAQQTVAMVRILREHVAPWLAQLDPPAAPDGTGEAALDIALGYVGQGEDPPGSNAGPFVAACFAGAVRGDRNGDGVEDPIGIRSGEWCAAFVGRCDAEAGVLLPWRAAVHECCSDARRLGKLHDVGSYVPQPGDRAVYGRSGQDPRRGGLGHISIVVTFDATGTYRDVNGNHGSTVALVDRSLLRDGPVAWIEAPRRQPAPEVEAPIAFESLGPIVLAVQAAAGRAGSVEAFESRDEGPLAA